MALTFRIELVCFPGLPREAAAQALMATYNLSEQEAKVAVTTLPREIQKGVTLEETHGLIEPLLRTGAEVAVINERTGHTVIHGPNGSRKEQAPSSDVGELDGERADRAAAARRRVTAQRERVQTGDFATSDSGAARVATSGSNRRVASAAKVKVKKSAPSRQRKAPISKTGAQQAAKEKPDFLTLQISKRTLYLALALVAMFVVFMIMISRSPNPHKNDSGLEPPMEGEWGFMKD
ncbi:MAG: hypothetical protein KC561_00270 [Myxococcales bacterium]|nr:hypothetical protein [Myxococcales bacterium]